MPTGAGARRARGRRVRRGDRRPPGARPGAAEGLLAAFEGALPSEGAGAAAALARADRGGARGGDPIERAALLSLRHRRHHAGRPGGRLAHLGARPEHVRLGVIAAAARSWRRSRSPGCASCSSCRDEFGGVLVTGDDDGQLHRPARGARLAGPSARASTSTRRASSALAPPAILSPATSTRARCRRSAMLGLGARTSGRWPPTASGGSTSRRSLRELERAAGNAIVIANAGEVNAGDFDPIAAIADLVEEHGAWLHVDGAFGLFARLAPESRELAAGVERADSVAADAHKWLNVPYDCGFAFVREPARLARALDVGAPYLPSPDDPRPELRLPHARRTRAAPARSRSGRRCAPTGARATGRWSSATCARPPARRAGRRRARARAAGRDVKLNIVCFRARPPGRRAGRARRAQPPPRRGAARATGACSPGRPSTTARSPSGRRSSTGRRPSPTSRCSSTCCWS